ICVLFVLSAMIGPLANRAHSDLSVHMLSHILLGMLAPLLIAFSSPLTLLLRILNVNKARRLIGLMKSWPLQLLTHPFFTAVISVGGLWILYTTSLYALMQQHVLLHIFVHLHVFVASYLFTISIISIDYQPHRSSIRLRSIVLLFALAAHGILSKYLFAHPPEGVSRMDAEKGSMMMYYGGDAVELLLIFIFCYQWYRATKPRVSSNIHSFV
ncbi:MAG: cytochrome c oxidase assembly protein, partial [Paenisporosarcina sp.]